MILEFQQGRLYDLVNDYCCQKWSIQQCCQGSLGGLECRVSCQSFPFTFASPSRSSAKNPRDMAIEGWVFSSVEEYWIKFVVPWAAVLVITHTKVRVLCGRTTKPSVGLWSSWEASLLSVLLSLHAHCFGESGDCWWCAWSCTLEQNCRIFVLQTVVHYHDHFFWNAVFGKKRLQCRDITGGSSRQFNYFCSNFCQGYSGSAVGIRGSFLGRFLLHTLGKIWQISWELSRISINCLRLPKNIMGSGDFPWTSIVAREVLSCYRG